MIYDRSTRQQVFLIFTRPSTGVTSVTQDHFYRINATQTQDHSIQNHPNIKGLSNFFSFLYIKAAWWYCQKFCSSHILQLWKALGWVQILLLGWRKYVWLFLRNPRWLDDRVSLGLGQVTQLLPRMPQADPSSSSCSASYHMVACKRP